MNDKSRKGIAVVAHSGGPTPVINASLLGVVEEAHRHQQITALYGARFGIAGILRQDFLDLFQQPAGLLDKIARTPSSALGSSRHEVSPVDLQTVFDVFRAHNVRYFFYTGGNGSMGTARQLQVTAEENRYDLQIVGIPKTIDNDLTHTDHTPGYASTARFFAHAVRDVNADNRALPNQVEFIEVLGRNVGWLAAATSLARDQEEDAPHLIYFPESPLPSEKLLDEVSAVYRRLHRCVVVVCEGQLDENGEPFGADVRAGSRGSLAMNLAHRLALLVSSRLQLRARSEKPGLLGRATSAYISDTDWNESHLCGRHAVKAAIEGRSGTMVTLQRQSSQIYTVKTALVELEKVAFTERLFPSEWINPQNNGVLPPFRDYIAPLVGPIEPHPQLLDYSIPKVT
jgi:ATP-dependent phosphofructokinase / diphosphate-dependent phosphofructokinase